MKNINISFQNLKSLPKDLPKDIPEIYDYNFYCGKYKLISLKGGLKFVKIYFSCSGNRLISLDFLPLNYMIVND